MTQTNGSQTKYSHSNQMALIQILIVDDLEVIREGLKVLLETESDFIIVGMANNGTKAIELVETQQPDIVLMDIEMPELDGISSTQIICQQFPQTKILVFTTYDEKSYINQFIEAGAKGYFLKGTPIEEVKQAIRAVYNYTQFSSGLLKNKARHGSSLEVESIEFSAVDALAPKSALASATKLSALNIPSENPSTIKQKSLWWRIVIGIAISLGIIAILGFAFAKVKSNLNPAPVETPLSPSVTAPTRVSALGEIEPEGEIIQLSVSSAAEGSRVEQLLVERGDRVQKNQVVAILDSYNRRLAALDKAKTDVQTAIANLERVQAGAKQGDINAQQAAIARLAAELRGQIASQQAEIARFQAELNNAESEYRRYQQLYKDGAISASDRDTKQLRVDTLKQQLAQANETLNRTIETTQVQRSEAQARLESISEVRSVDVQVAQSELEQARATVKQAQADLELTEVRSPIDGQVLKVNVRPGEVVGNNGIIAVGKTDRMYVVAEVYETEVEKVQLGQKAIVTGAAFSQELEGEVAQIGLEVKQQDVFDSDPLVNTDNKVVEVKIRLSPESSKRVTALSNLQVQVVIIL